ncbi:uncharacterized protein LOC133197356 [Saccostrea echinata]|uniref:uncharacterized protein LOC133197356 n=1 Tax=Saccostrea echinata TaxID=191078 RepID=UPI002A7FD225|nr:uncharacterized protein LOC133197356 [Saccostrea echinata]
MAACSVKTIENERKGLFDAFHTDFLSRHSSFLDAVDKFKMEMTALGAYEIGSSNSADPGNFKKAVCTLKPTNKKFAFAGFFIPAFKMLRNFVKNREIPDDGRMKMLLERLVKFLINTEVQAALSQMKDCSDETDLIILLVFHLFSLLSLSSYFTVDQMKSSQPKVCPCRRKHSKIIYGDTSIGNTDVWHGNIDLIMEADDVIIVTPDGGTSEDTREDMKRGQFDMNDNSAGSSLVQVAAKTIVHSFYYNQIHPDHSNTLIPCIGVAPMGLIFYFYDSVHDVLLGSTHFPLATFSPLQLNWTAIIAVWMVLNHNYLCNGLSSLDVDEVPKSNFFDIARSKLDIYKHELKRGQVGTRHFNVLSLDPHSFINSKFIASPELEDL